MKAAQTPLDRQTRMAAVVFADLVGFSKKTVPAQLAAKEALTELLQRFVAPYPKTARVILDTGDGAAVGFLVNPESALALALRLRRELAEGPADALLQSSDLRLGINLGPVKVVTDVNGQPNIIGEGINSAERIMSFAEPGHTTASRSFQEAVFYLDPAFQSLFEPLGTRADKHGREHEVFRLTTSTDAIAAALQSLGIGPTVVEAGAAAGRGTALEGESAAGLGGLGRPARIALAAGVLVVVAATATWYVWPARRAPLEAGTPPAATSAARPEPATPRPDPTPAQPEPAAARPEPPPPAAGAATPAESAGASGTSEPAPRPAAPAPPDPPAATAKKAKVPATPPKSTLAGAPTPPQGSARAADPAVAPVRSSSPRCTQLLQRAAVGEALTADEQRELATSCR